MANEDLSKLKIDKSAGTFRRKQKIPKALLAAIGVVFVLLTVIIFVRNRSVGVDTVVVSRVYPSQTFTLLNASGYVVAQRKAAVSSKATGRLEWLGVEEGSKVKKGEVIARLEDRDVVAVQEQAAANLENAKSALTQARAEYDDASVNYTRSKDLLAKGFISQMDFDTADARYKRAVAGVSGAQSAINAAQAALRSAEVAVEYTRVRAPFDAVVLTKDADVGDIVTPFGAAVNAKADVVTVADMSSLQVEADVSESNLEKVKKGQPCEIQLDALPDSRFRGEVHMIVPTADRSKASVMVKVRFLDRDSRVLPEMSARVAFLERAVAKNEEAPKTAVNPAAIVERDGKKSVFVVKDDAVVLTTVTTGEPMGDLVEIHEGVKPGDKVVVNPPAKLKNGSRITINVR
ncbi:MAG: efflux RND transporter periplasmic adaptor subunit [Betaproteobacteria bacterium]